MFGDHKHHILMLSHCFVLLCFPYFPIVLKANHTLFWIYFSVFIILISMCFVMCSIYFIFKKTWQLKNTATLRSSQHVSTLTLPSSGAALWCRTSNTYLWMDPRGLLHPTSSRSAPMKMLAILNIFGSPIQLYILQASEIDGLWLYRVVVAHDLEIPAPECDSWFVNRRFYKLEIRDPECDSWFMLRDPVLELVRITSPCQ